MRVKKNCELYLCFRRVPQAAVWKIDVGDQGRRVMEWEGSAVAVVHIQTRAVEKSGRAIGAQLRRSKGVWNLAFTL